MRKLVTAFDNVLNSITMYKLVLFGLSWLAGMALLLTGIDVLSFNLATMIASLLSLFVVCGGLDLLLAKIYKVPSNHESAVITALILFFIMGIPISIAEMVGILLAGVLAIASKYVITWRGANIVNPAAFGALIASATGVGFAAWWVATPWMLPFVALLGLCVLHKLRRYEVFFAFLVPALLVLVSRDVSPLLALQSWPLVFFGTIMLTEPATMPNGRSKRIVYAVVVGVLFALPLSVFGLTMTPQLALIIGNVFAFLLVARASTKAILLSKTKLTPTSYEFVFQPDRRLQLRAGQYLDWTLDGIKLNTRGNRRSFTVASSPTATTLAIGVKFNKLGSRFKERLLDLSPGDTILASRPNGEFVLPASTKQKLVFIAGGIGITPFAAMLREAQAKNDRSRDIVLYYFTATKEEVAYKHVLDTASKHGVSVQYKAGATAHITAEELAKTVPDFAERLFYISGPPSMVRSYKTVLQTAGIPRNHIKTDYFSGY